MQAQNTRTEVKAITASQSLAVVQTMLRAGLGCITFLRNLLPDENFTESHFTTTDDRSLAHQSSDASFSSTDSNEQRRHVNGFKIMTMARGYSDEADKILNYLEYGIFHALQQQYLRSFVFAIYLDNKDPNNIVEAYTFNFHYHTIPGTDTVIPIMSLGDGLRNMSLKDNHQRVDPATEAAKNGKAPTLREVKKSVKNLLKTLIHATTQMDDLPKHRFATFKLFYTDKTPPDYEPPHFQPGDAEKDKWFLMTHNLDEVPDTWNIGRVDTGHHSVKLSITSIATYLPSSAEHDGAAFAGTTSSFPNHTTPTPRQEASIRAQQSERQSKDADERNIMWDGEVAVEVHDLDGEGEDDPDYVQRPDGTYERIVFHDSNPKAMAPIGVRNEAGDIEPIEPIDLLLETEEVYFGGASEKVPTQLNELNVVNNPTRTSGVEQTQDINSSTASAQQSSPTLVEDVSLNRVSLEDHEQPEDAEMLDMETQILPPAFLGSIDSIDSYGRSFTEDNIETDTTSPQHVKLSKDAEDVIDNGLECECGVSVEDESCFCEGGCGRWYHVWCMGYNSTKDPRMPSKFICFDCRARANVSWVLMKVELYPRMLLKFQELALFRRAIKVAEKRNPETPVEFAKSLGGDNTLARQLFKRLEVEGFISEQSATLDDLGLTETRSRSLRNGRKTGGKQNKSRKNVQKSKYKFNRSALSTVEYTDYFNPDPDVEARVMGLSDLGARFKAPNNILPEEFPLSKSQPSPVLPSHHECETQTQEETQSPTHGTTDHPLKRTKSGPDIHDTSRPAKKVKISVTYGVDLAE